MEYSQFMNMVKEYGGLPEEEALNAVGAVLSTLGERLQNKHREHLATQLPGELGPLVLKLSRREVFPLETFYERIGARAKLRLHEAIRQTRAVFHSLQSAIAQGELNDIFAELTPEWVELLGRKPERITPTTVDIHELFSKS